MFNGPEQNVTVLEKVGSGLATLWSLVTLTPAGDIIAPQNITPPIIPSNSSGAIIPSNQTVVSNSTFAQAKEAAAAVAADHPYVTAAVAVAGVAGLAYQHRNRAPVKVQKVVLTPAADQLLQKLGLPDTLLFMMNLD